jgi:RNA polymerase sigma-70 factor, ECF subfamily
METENELVKKILAGDQSAFSVLVETYQSPVYNLCYRMLGEAREAEDAAQETFLRVYDRLGSFDASRSFKTWILSIANHHCIDRLRKRRIVWLDIEDEPLVGHPALRERSAGPEEQAVKHEQRERVQSLLAELGPKDRSAIVMHYWYDLSYEEIAHSTGTTVSAVKSRLHRARAVMAEMLSPTQARPSTPPAISSPWMRGRTSTIASAQATTKAWQGGSIPTFAYA